MPTAVRLKTTADTPVAGMPARVVICTEVVDPGLQRQPVVGPGVEEPGRAW